jgi:hypothetical protein
MSYRSLRALLFVVATVAASGCGAGGPLAADPYGYDAEYGGESGYGVDTGGSFGSPYGSSLGGVSAGTSLGMSYGGSYDTDFSDVGASARPASSGTYGDFGAAYGDDAVVRARASAAPTPPPVAPTTLSAWITDVKEPGFFARLRGAKITARVEVENPADRTLSGRVRVRFLDGGDPTGVIQTRRVTLAPGEKVVLTFTAEAGRLDDAEASVETLGTPVGGSIVVDRTGAGA